ncbi:MULTISPECIES: hypothetical protein [unclassified Micromonospora]|uniref:hypothetical protein n=1 Tax=unclassified Micromonospora TaxID=2617518 RepID=UPI002FF3D3CB
MGTELQVTLDSGHAAVDARSALLRLEGLLDLLAELEAGERIEDAAGRRRPAPRSRWTFSDLGLGSIRAALAPLEPRPGGSFDAMDEVPVRAVDGFLQAEEEEIVPDGWSVTAARKARALTRHFGVTEQSGMRLSLIVDGLPKKTILVTRRSSVHLTRALQIRRESIGSVTGRIDSMSVHKKPYAGLWAKRGGRRIQVDLPSDDLVDVARDALGKDVTVRGRIRRNDAGQILLLRASSIEPLPEATEPLVELAGAFPDLTGGQDPVTYLEGLRGSA